MLLFDSFNALAVSQEILDSSHVRCRCVELNHQPYCLTVWAQNNCAQPPLYAFFRDQPPPDPFLYPTITSPKMDQIEKTLQTICANRQRNQDFTPRKKTAIVAAVAAGVTHRRASELVGAAKSTITRIVSKFATTGTIEPRPRKGRRPISEARKRFIFTLVKRNRKARV